MEEAHVLRFHGLYKSIHVYVEHILSPNKRKTEAAEWQRQVELFADIYLAFLFTAETEQDTTDTINSLDISGNRVGVHSAMAFADWLRRMGRVVKLEMIDVLGPPSPDTALILETLLSVAGETQLVSLNLSQNDLSLDHIVLSNSLPFTQSLEELILRDTNLGGRGHFVIANALRDIGFRYQKYGQKHPLKRLNVSSSPFGLGAGKSWARALVVLPNLVSLNFSQNRFSLPDTLSVIQSLVTLPNLQYIDIESCAIADVTNRSDNRCIQALAQGLSVWKGLKYLNILRGGISPSGIEIILDALRTTDHHELQELYLQSAQDADDDEQNEDGSGGGSLRASVWQLAATSALHHAHSLMWFGLAGGYFDVKGEAARDLLRGVLYRRNGGDIQVVSTNNLFHPPLANIRLSPERLNLLKGLDGLVEPEGKVRNILAVNRKRLERLASDTNQLIFGGRYTVEGQNFVNIMDDLNRILIVGPYSALPEGVLSPFQALREAGIRIEAVQEAMLDPTEGRHAIFTFSFAHEMRLARAAIGSGFPRLEIIEESSKVEWLRLYFPPRYDTVMHSLPPPSPDVYPRFNGKLRGIFKRNGVYFVPDHTDYNETVLFYPLNMPLPLCQVNLGLPSTDIDDDDADLSAELGHLAL